VTGRNGSGQIGIGQNGTDKMGKMVQFYILCTL